MNLDTYTSAALLNVDGLSPYIYTPTVLLAPVVRSDDVTSPIRFSVSAEGREDALEQFLQVARKVRCDDRGQYWPEDIRSIREGDVLALFVGEPDEMTPTVQFIEQATCYAITPRAPLPIRGSTHPGIENKLTPVAGTRATSRPGPDRPGVTRSDTAWLATRPVFSLSDISATDDFSGMQGQPSTTFAPKAAPKASSEF